MRSIVFLVLLLSTNAVFAREVVESCKNIYMFSPSTGGPVASPGLGIEVYDDGKGLVTMPGMSEERYVVEEEYNPAENKPLSMMLKGLGVSVDEAEIQNVRKINLLNDPNVWKNRVIISLIQTSNQGLLKIGLFNGSFGLCGN